MAKRHLNRELQTPRSLAAAVRGALHIALAELEATP